MQEITTIERHLMSNFTFLPQNLGYNVITQPHFAMISCGFKSYSFNLVCINDKIYGNYQDLLNMVESYYHNIPFIWRSSSNNTTAAFDAFFKKNNYINILKETILLHYLQNLTPVTLGNLTIKHVLTMEHMQDYCSVLKSLEPDIENFYLNNKIISPQILRNNHLFVVYLGQEAVATASLFFDNNICSLHDLVVVEKYRNIGIGAKIIRYLLQLAKDKNFKYLCASSTSSLFARHGFKAVSHFNCYTKLK